MPRTLLHIFSTFATGGPQVRTIDLAAGLGQGYRHLVVALDGDTSAADRLDTSVPLEISRYPLAVNKCFGISLKNLRNLRELLCKERPDLLLTYNFGALEAALANRLRPLCPHIHFEDGFGPEEANGRQLSRRVWLRRMALTGHHSLLVVPSRTLECLALRTWRLARERVLYIPNGIDTRSYVTGPEEADDGTLVVGSVGLLRPEKNFARLLRVFARLTRESLPPVRLELVGDGPERLRLEALAAELGIADRVCFVGQVVRLAVPAALRRFSVFALTSDTEQMPYSVIEAMAAGLPVVATDVGDVRNMLPPESRDWVVSVTDEDALVARLSMLLRDPLLRMVTGRRHRVHARAHYAVEAMLRHYETLFGGLLGVASPDRYVQDEGRGQTLKAI
jgi:glycosyltransferase involved in cell wall biosynthesis